MQIGIDQKKEQSEMMFHNEDQISSILETSKKAFEEWKKVDFSEKKRLMIRLAELLEEDKEKLSVLITTEMGKVIKQSRSEIEKCAAASKFYAEKAEEFLKSEIIESGATKSFIAYQPLGSILAVMPWNFPFWQVVRFSAPALMAGNTAILKHASNVPGCASALEELHLRAGFPSGVFQTLFVEGKNMTSIVEDNRVKAITLTGSEQAGSKVAEAAGRSIKKTVLELGGSDAFIVLGDADLEIAVDTAVKARMVNTGQSCIAAKRFIVVERIYDQFLTAFKTKMANQKIGDPFDEASDYGPLAKAEFAKALQEQINNSVKKGAKVVLGGDWESSKGAYFPATILENIRPGMPAYEEEFFGPVALLIKAKDENDAVRIANDTKFGLGASIWTRNSENGEKLALQVDSGMVFVNKMVASHPALPFGGVKSSGYGRELSYLGIREFTNIKTINIA
jgi:succinate-semialdehyde dehydrogenase / glutarate-semialdehyde dehydrogenase